MLKCLLIWDQNRFLKSLKRVKSRCGAVAQGKGNGHSPLGRLGKHGTCRKSQDGLIILKVGRATSMTAHYRGVSNMVPLESE